MLMLLACAFFATMAIAVGLATRWDTTLTSWVTSAARAWVNLAVLVVIARGDLRRLVGDARPALWLRGLAGAGALLTYFAALGRTGVGEAAFLNQTSALWVALLAPVLLHERTPRAAWVAIGGSIVGMALLAAPREAAPDTIGRVLGLTSGMFAAVAYVAVRRSAESNASITIVFWFTVIGSAVATVAALGSGAPLPRDPWVWSALVTAGVTATFGQILMTEAYRRAPAALVAATGAAGPLLTAVGGWWILHDAPDRAGLAGMALLTVSAVVLPLMAGRTIPTGGAPGAQPVVEPPALPPR